LVLGDGPLCRGVTGRIEVHIRLAGVGVVRAVVDTVHDAVGFGILAGVARWRQRVDGVLLPGIGDGRAVVPAVPVAVNIGVQLGEEQPLHRLRGLDWRRHAALTGRILHARVEVRRRDRRKQ
jgi:hypothetical protein